MEAETGTKIPQGTVKSYQYLSFATLENLQHLEQGFGAQQTEG